MAEETRNPMYIKSKITRGEHAGKEMTIVIDGITRVFVEKDVFLVGDYAEIMEAGKNKENG